jgi:hypothetical protein
MDVVDMGRSPSDFRLAVVFIECYTKFPVVAPLAAYTGKLLLAALMTFVVSYFGIPLEIVADGHATHSSRDFADACTRMGISLNLSKGHSHTHAGQSERYIRTVLAMLRRSAEEARDWVETLPMVLLYYRAAIHPATGYSPAYMMYGEGLRLPCAKLLDFRNPQHTVDMETTVKEIADSLAVANKVVLQTNERYRAQMVEDYRREHHQSPSTVRVGDSVYVPCTEKMNRNGRVKLDPKRYRGPFTVVEIAPNLPLLKICDSISGKTETINRRFVTKCDRQLAVPYLPPRRRNRQERVVAPPPVQDFPPNLHYNFRSNKCSVQNSLVYRHSNSIQMSTDGDMDVDRLLDDAPMRTGSTISTTLSEEDRLLDPEPPLPRLVEKAERTFNRVLPTKRVDFEQGTREQCVRDEKAAEHSAARRTRSRSRERRVRVGFHNGKRAYETHVHGRSDAGRSRRRRHDADRDGNGYDRGENAASTRARSPSTDFSHAPHRKKTDEGAVKRWMDSRAQIHITNGATLLSGKMTFVHELIKTPISAYAGAVEQSRGKGFLPTRAVEPLDSKLIVSLVSEKESKYSKMYREYIVSFVSFSADRYRALKWDRDAYSAAVNALVRCGLAGLMPPSVD